MTDVIPVFFMRYTLRQNASPAARIIFLGKALKEVMLMDVYGEYLFAENFIAGYVIIKLTGALCGRKPSGARTAGGSVLCGLFSFVIFINIPGAVGLALNLFFSALAVYAVFEPSGFRSGARITAVFYMVSFLLGGAAIAAVYASGTSGAVSGGIFYIGSEAYVLIAAGAASAVFMGAFTLKFIKKAAVKADEIVKIDIEIMGKNISCRAKFDTANYLKEPLSGKPVSIMEKKAAESAWGTLCKNRMLDNRLRAIPYSSLGRENGMIMALRCDNMVIDRGDIFGGNRIYLRNVYIGLYDGVFSGDGGEQDYAVLLQPELICERCGVK